MTNPTQAVDGGALPAVPQTHDPDLEAIYRLWIDMIREARMLGGRDAARRLWRQSPLPPLDSAKGKGTPDWVASFLADSTEPAPGARLRAEALWAAYVAWCQPRGLEPIKAGFASRRGAELAAIHRMEGKADGVVEFPTATIDSYRQQVEALGEDTFVNDDARQEAMNAVRALIARVDVHPGERRGQTQVKAFGLIEKLISPAQDHLGGASSAVGRTATMVAAEGFEPPTKGL